MTLAFEPYPCMLRFFFSLFFTLTVFILVGSTAELRPSTTCANSPLHYIELHRPPPTLPPDTCPIDGEPLVSDEFVSFQEWKSRQIEANESPLDEPDAPNNQLVVASASSLTGAGTGFDGSMGSIPDPMAFADMQPRVPLTDRFNYASPDCKARVHSSHPHPGKSHAGSILSSKRDKYMLSPCSTTGKFVVVELCDDIKVDTVQLANFEWFSGVFKEVTISLAGGRGDRVAEPGVWDVAGTYTAANTRTIQSFRMPPHTRKFYRYIRIDLISHYGSEYYCPLSLLRVYGLTHMEEWKWEEWLAVSRAEHLRSVVHDDPVVTLETPVVEPKLSLATPVVVPVQVEELMEIVTSEIPGNAKPTSSEASLASSDSPSGQEVTESTDPADPTSTSQSSSSSASAIVEPSHVTHMPLPTGESEDVQDQDPITRNEPETQNVVGSASPIEATGEGQASSSKTGATAINPASSASAMPGESPIPVSAALISGEPVATPVSIKSPRGSPIVINGYPPPVVSDSRSQSIYLTIMNRLQALEGNATLGVQYAEDQSRRIRQSLKRLEEEVGRLESVTKIQHQNFQRKFAELEKRCKNVEDERQTLKSQIESLSDEIALEKWLGVAQICLLLTLLVFMAFTRGSASGLDFNQNRTLIPRLASDGRPRMRAQSDDFVTSRPQTAKDAATPIDVSSLHVQNGNLTQPWTPSPSESSSSKPLPNLPPTELTPPATRFTTLETRRQPILPTPALFQAQLLGYKRSRSHSGPRYSDHLRGGSSVSLGGGIPGTVPRRLAKTAHLHHVKTRRRKVSSQSSGGVETEVPQSNPNRVTDVDLFAPSSSTVMQANHSNTSTPRRQRVRGKYRVAHRHSRSVEEEISDTPSTQWVDTSDEDIAVLRGDIKDSPTKTSHNVTDWSGNIINPPLGTTIPAH